MNNLEKEIEKIKKRNDVVSADKAWETCRTRKVIIAFLTYITMVIFFMCADLPQPFINALVPSLAFLLSTMSLNYLKKMWIHIYH